MSLRKKSRKKAPLDEKERRLQEVWPVNQPDHQLFEYFSSINQRLRRLPIVPGVLTVQDVHRMAAQLLLECWVIGMEQIDGLAVDSQEQLVAWQDNLPDVGGRLSVTLDVMQALSYSVDETSLALEETMAAWPLTAAQRRALHRAGSLSSPLKAGTVQVGAGPQDLSVR